MYKYLKLYYKNTLQVYKLKTKQSVLISILHNNKSQSEVENINILTDGFLAVASYISSMNFKFSFERFAFLGDFKSFGYAFEISFFLTLISELDT